MSNGKPFHSLNATLNALRISNLESEFITVSPITGVGDYTSIVEAVNAGHPYIFVKSGTYLETADIVLDGQNLIGESPKTTIIQLVDHSIEFETHDIASAYDTGTAQIVNNATQVNGGGGTLWDTGVNAPSGFSDPWLIMEGMAFEIASFANDTTLNLSEQYRGDTITGNYYIVDLKNNGSIFTGFTVEHSPTVGTPCMLISGIGITVERNVFKCDRLNTTYVMRTGPTTLSVAAMVKIRDNLVISGSTGIELKNAHSCVVESNVLENQNDHAIRTNTDDHDCRSNTISNNKIYGCTNTAIELDTNSHFTVIDGNDLQYCRNIGIDMDDCDYCRAENNKIDTVTTGVTMQMLNNCRYCSMCNNIVSPGDWELDTSLSKFCGNELADGSMIIVGDNNIANDNVIVSGLISIDGDNGIINDNFIYTALNDYGIEVDGARGTVVGNLLRDCDSHGIGLDGAGAHVCSGNMINSPAGNGIECLAPNCVVSDNILYDVADHGIETDQTADGCIFEGNRIHSNAGDSGIRIQGRDCTINGNNIDNMTAGAGIEIVQVGGGDGDETLIQNNKIKTAVIGILVDSDHGECKIDGNHIHTATGVGIQINSIGGYSYSVNNNTLVDVGAAGIYLDNGGRYSTINGNVIENPTSHGIHLASGINLLHCNIIGNTINSAGGSGIFLDREGQVTGNRNDYCIINGNNIYDCTAIGILLETLRGIVSNNRSDDGGSSGIVVRNGDQSIISNNGCDNNTTSGIDIENTADRIVITGNICLNNGVNQILNNGTNTVAANNIVA